MGLGPKRFSVVIIGFPKTACAIEQFLDAIGIAIGIKIYGRGGFGLKLRTKRLIKRLEPPGFAVGESNPKASLLWKSVNENVDENQNEKHSWT